MVTTAANARPTDAELRRAITLAQDWLLADQDPAGFWWGELESNASITAEYLLLTHHLGIGNREQWDGIARYLRAQQREQGFWAQYLGGPGDISTSVEAYFALKLAGDDPDAPHMSRAREWILEHGGIASTRVFTKIWLALFGQYRWDRLPAMPAWLNLLPNWFPVNLYEFASWARATVVGITVIMTLRPTASLPAGAGVPELWVRAPPTAAASPSRRPATGSAGRARSPSSTAPCGCSTATTSARSRAARSPRPSAGCSTARRPTAAGAASSRPGSTRSSPCARWATRSTIPSCNGPCAASSASPTTAPTTTTPTTPTARG